MKKCPACNKEYQNTNLIVCPNDKTMLLTPERDELIGKIIKGKYRITEEIYRGSKNAIYKCIHEQTRGNFAVKCLNAERVSDQAVLKRFQTEAQSATPLQHPNIVNVYDYGVVPSGRPYLVMDFLEGETLADKIRRENRVHPKRMIDIFIQACAGLGHAHEKGIIHGSLGSKKFILIELDGKKDFLKITDLTIATLLSAVSMPQSQSRTAQSQCFVGGILTGSANYFSPESCLGQKPDGRSDVYSIGVMMYESLTGQVPFYGVSALDTMQMHVSTPPKAFCQVRADLEIPEELELIVMKALEKSRSSGTSP